MTRKGTIYACSACGAHSPKWMGVCSNCGDFGTMAALAPEPVGKGGAAGAAQALEALLESGAACHPTGLTELDRVLGGGIVPESVILLVGEPGIGKSTLALQAAMALAAQGLPVLLVAGEETPSRIKERARRLGSSLSHLYVTDEREIEGILSSAARLKPALLVVDSIQSAQTSAVEGVAGRPAQIEASTRLLQAYARTSGASVLITGHVTKGDEMAGPRTLEHQVDQVLYLEGQRQEELRWLRSVKNRFGATFEVGLFRMEKGGLKDVTNPSQVLLEGRPEGAAGSVVAPVVEGSRVLLVEVQALVGPAKFQSSRVRCRGVAPERAEMVAAVLERRLGLPLRDADIFLNVIGGLDVTEPGLDLPVAAAIFSSLTGKALPAKTAVAGEIGLAAELRPLGNLDLRRAEAARAGFTELLAPGPKGPKGLREALSRLGLGQPETPWARQAGSD